MAAEPPRFLECRLKVRGKRIGSTTREAELVDVRGHALLGPATFPAWKPKLHAGERATWLRGSWVIVARAGA